MHADDILLLATSRSLAIEKLRCLMTYSKNNYIKLQLSKCALICVNSNDLLDHEPIKVNNVILKSSSSEVYLGSVITNSHKLTDDVEADIKKRQISIVKFYAFLRRNKNAPVEIKLKVLESCIVSSLLHNAETWADTNIDNLEIIHRRMLRSILGVNMRTCTELLYLELNVCSLKTIVLTKQWKFWKKVSDLNNNDPLAYVVSLGVGLF